MICSESICIFLLGCVVFTLHDCKAGQSTHHCRAFPMPTASRGPMLATTHENSEVHKIMSERMKRWMNNPCWHAVFCRLLLGRTDRSYSFQLRGHLCSRCTQTAPGIEWNRAQTASSCRSCFCPNKLSQTKNASLFQNVPSRPRCNSFPNRLIPENLNGCFSPCVQMAVSRCHFICCLLKNKVSWLEASL